MKPRALLALTLAALSGGCWLTASFDGLTDGGGHDGATGKDAGGDVARAPMDASRSDAKHVDASGNDVTTDTRRDGGMPHDAGHETSQVGSDSGVTCINATTYPASVRAAGAIAYWRLGDPTGSTAIDVLGQHDGQYAMMGVTFQQLGPLADDASASVELDGVSGEVLVSPDGGFSEFIGKQAYTVEAWIKPTLVDNMFRGVLSSELVRDAGKQGYVLFVEIDAGIGLDRYGTGVSTPLRKAIPISESGWTHVVGTYDPTGNGTAMLYVNGAPIPSMPSSFSIVGGCTFAIGGTHCGTTGFFRGNIAEVALYNHVLDPACIAAHYAFHQ